MRTTRTVLMLSSALGLLVALPAMAQEAATAPQPTVEPVAASPSQAALPADSEDIIVTAQKREQALFEVPQSISVISGEALDRRQARSIADYAALVPGLSIEQGNPGNTRVVLRGINSGGASPTVSIYVDDTPFGSSTSQTNGAGLTGDFDTFDIERIEALRGPQGTLYGANSLGGVIKYVTVAPKLSTFEGKGQAGVETTKGGDTGYSGNAVINLPIGDTLAFRASGFYRRTAGYLDAIGIPRNNVNRFDSYGGRASLLFQPTDRLTIQLSALAQNIRADSRAAFDAEANTLRPITRDPISGAPVSGENRYERFRDKNDVDYRLYTGSINYDFGFATLTSVTSYSRLFQDDRSDVSFADQGGISLGDLVSLAIYGLPTPDYGIFFPSQITQKKFTQEVRLASAKSDTFEWLIGGYYTREPGRIFQRYFPYAAATGQPIDPPPVIPGFDQLVLAQLNSVYKEYAAFGSATLHLGDRFDVTAGGRYSHNKQRTTQILDGALFGGRSEEVNRSSEGVFTWSVSPRFEIGERSEIYARIAKGYRPGGPNVVPPGAPANYPFTTKADTLVSYETGVRAETADRKFGIDASIYYLDWKDTLILAAFPTAAGPIFADANGEGAKSYGFEATMTARPARGLTAIGSVAYNHSELEGDTGAGGFDGDQLPFAPHWNANLALDYSWEMGGAKPYVGGDVSLVSDRPTNFDTAYQTAVGRRAFLDGYATVNLRGGVEFGVFNLSVYAKNLTNSRALTAVGAFGERLDGAIAAVPIRPRTVGATLGFNF